MGKECGRRRACGVAARLSDCTPRAWWPWGPQGSKESEHGTAEEKRSRWTGSPGFYAGRVVGGHHHHRHVDGIADAGNFRSREQGRRTQCMNNQKQLGVALLAYEGSHRSFPGWQNYGDAASRRTAIGFHGWPCCCRTWNARDLWQKVKSRAQVPYARANSLKLLTCPSDPPDTTTGVGPSAYIANGLVLRDQWTASAATAATVSVQPWRRKHWIMSPRKDGTTNTLMLGENTQTPPTAAAAAGAMAKAHNWYDVTLPATANRASGINPSSPRPSASISPAPLRSIPRALIELLPAIYEQPVNRL